MPKFKNKKTGKVVKEHLLYYVERLRNNPNYIEVIEKQPKLVKNQEVEEEQPLQ